MPVVHLNTKAVESAFALKAREFAKDAVNIFWMRDLKFPDVDGTNKGLPFVPDEFEISQFCEGLGVTLCRNFELSFETESNMLYAALSSGCVTAYIRVAPLNADEKDSPVVVDMGFLVSVSPPTLMPVEAFSPMPSNES